MWQKSGKSNLWAESMVPLLAPRWARGQDEEAAVLRAAADFLRTTVFRKYYLWNYPTNCFKDCENVRLELLFDI
jgi:hypothetical protein